MGTGTEREFYIRGRPHSDRWWQLPWHGWLLPGLALLAAGVFGGFVGLVGEWVPGREAAGIAVSVLSMAGGVFMVRQALRQFSDDRAVQRAWEREFTPK